jgi:hypothetical protein
MLTPMLNSIRRTASAFLFVNGRLLQQARKKEEDTMSNALTQRCEDCNGQVPDGRKKRFCSTQCATRARVRRHRLNHSNGEGQAYIKIRRQQQSGEVRREQIAARKQIRQTMTAERHVLRKAHRQAVRELAVKEKAYIVASDAKIAQKSEIAIAQDFDDNVISLAIAESDRQESKCDRCVFN